MERRTVEEDIRKLAGLVTKAYGKYHLEEEVRGIPLSPDNRLIFNALILEGGTVHDAPEDICCHSEVRPEWVGYRVLDWSQTSAGKSCHGKPSEICYMKK